jgi:hypothetical protein
MARHRRRRRRSYGDYISVPLGFGKFKLPGVKGLNPLGKSVGSTDVAIGMVAGTLGGSVLARQITNFWPTAPEFVQRYMGPISAILAGVLAKMLLKNQHKGEGIYVGAALAGVVPIVTGMAAGMLPGIFQGYVDVNLGGYGLLTDVNPMGLLVDEGSQRMSELAAYSMGEDQDDYSGFPY